MKIGCETIIFGAQLDDLDHTLATLAHLGFSGVEFSQRPRRIYLYDSATGSHHPVSIEELASRQTASHFWGWPAGPWRNASTSAAIPTLSAWSGWE